MLEFVATAYLISSPFILMGTLFLKDRSKVIAVNLLAVANVTMLAYSYFLVRQLLGLWQLAKQLHISFASSSVPKYYIIQLILVALIPLLFIHKRLTPNKFLSLLLWSLLVLLRDFLKMESNWLLLLFPILFYLCLLCAAYALLWLLKRLPDQLL